MTDPKPRIRARWRPRWLIGLAVCAAAVLLLVLGVVAQRRAIARALITSQLRALGLEEVTHAVERFGFAEFGVRDLRIGSQGDLVVAKIDARYSLASLMAGRLEDLSVRGVRLRGTVGEAGVSLGALDRLLSQDTGGAVPAMPAAAEAAPFVALPATNVSIDDFHIELATPRGVLAATLEVRARDTGGGHIEARAALSARHALFAGGAQIALRGRAEAFEGDADIELRVAGEIAEDIELEPALFTLAAGFAYADERVEVALDPMPIAVAVRRGGETFRVEGETPALSLALPAVPGGDVASVHVAGSGGRLRLPDIGVEARDVAIDVDFEQGASLPSGSLRIGALSETGKPRRLPPLALEATFEPAEGALRFAAAATSPGAELVLRIRGEHDPETGRGSAHVRLKPLVFEADGLQPGALLPELRGLIEAASGSVGARGRIHWGGMAISGSLELAIHELSLALEQGSVERLNAVIQVDGPWPLSTPPDQLISMAGLDAGIQLANGRIVFQLRRDGVLDIASAEWPFAGGRIHTRGTADLRAETQDLMLRLTDVDLAELLALVDLDGLSGSGRVEGRLPVVRRGELLEIRDGELLAGAEGGWIYYRPGAGVAGAVGQEQGANLFLEALENFRYEELVATLEGDVFGEVQMRIHVAGANPNYLGGQPFELNFNIEARLSDILESATMAYEIPQEIEKRFQEMSE